MLLSLPAWLLKRPAIIRKSALIRNYKTLELQNMGAVQLESILDPISGIQSYWEGNFRGEVEYISKENERSVIIIASLAMLYKNSTDVLKKKIIISIEDVL